AGEQAGASVNGGNAASFRAAGRVFHLADHFHQEQQLAITGTRGGIAVFEVAPVVLELDLEARINNVAAVLDVLLLRRPAFAVGRIGEHEVEAIRGKLVGRQGGADLDVFRVVALDHHV